MAIVAYVEVYTGTDEDGNAVTGEQYVTDYSSAGLAQLAADEASGVVIYSIDEDGTRTQVSAASVTNPNAGSNGSAAMGASYDYTGGGGGGGLQPQSDSYWTGTVTVGSVTLEFGNGLLLAVS